MLMLGAPARRLAPQGSATMLAWLGGSKRWMKKKAVQKTGPVTAPAAQKLKQTAVPWGPRAKASNRPTPPPSCSAAAPAMATANAAAQRLEQHAIKGAKRRLDAAFDDHTPPEPAAKRTAAPRAVAGGSRQALLSLDLLAIRLPDRKFCLEGGALAQEGAMKGDPCRGGGPEH